MVSFGVDFAFHALGRYHEERRADRWRAAGRSYVLGLTAVFGSLTLALVSDSLAFLSNVTASIPSMVQFGVGAAIALAAAFVVLGILASLAVAGVDVMEDSRVVAQRGRALRIVEIILASIFAGAAVLTLIVFPPIGVAVVVVYRLLFIGVLLVLIRRAAVEAPRGIASTEVPAEDSLTLGITARLIGRLSTARAADVDRESFG